MTREEIKEEIIKILCADIADDKVSVEYHNIIREEIGKQAGKPISKRLETAIKKRFHEDTLVYLDKNYGMYHIVIWGGNTGRKYDDRFSALVGYHTNPFLSVEEFEDKDTCHGNAALERIAIVEKQIENGYVDTLVDAIINYKVAEKSLKSALGESYKNPCYFAITNKFSLPK